MSRYIGAHVSASGGVYKAPGNARKIGATAFALFLKNQKRWTSPPYDQNTIDLFKKACFEEAYKPEQILPHDGYLINLGNPDPEKRALSYSSFLDEAVRCEQLGLIYLNFHPGSHLKLISEEQCLDIIAGEVNRAIESTEKVIFVIENTSGQGTNTGYRFEHLAHIISRINNKKRIGVCLDTCHTYTSGYDWKGKYEEVWKDFERIIGLSYLKGIHLNDCKKDLGSRVDRHETLGSGTLGKSFFEQLVRDSRVDGIPLVLETPDETLWAEEIAFLKSAAD